MPPTRAVPRPAHRRPPPGRHRAPRPPRRPGVAAGTPAGALAATVLAVGAAGTAPAAAATDADFARLRMCESSNNYSINTGNGYYGAYQFDLPTWASVGGRGYPHLASPAEQDHRARLLYASRGWAPWPACSARLGLAGGRYAPPAPAVPAWPGARLSYLAHRDTFRSDTYAIQRRLRSKGWPVELTGRYGINTHWWVTAVQLRYGGFDGRWGVVGPDTWRVLFTI
jgi:hypothetical protein